MPSKHIIATLVASITISALGSCGARGSSAGTTVIKSTTSGDLTISLMNSSGHLKSGESSFILAFADGSGKPVDVGAVSLKLHMPAMGGMAEMNDVATLTTTETPGRYNAIVNIEMQGTWESLINYQGPKGTGQKSMTVNVE